MARNRGKSGSHKLWDWADEALLALAVDLVVDALLIKCDRVLFSAAAMFPELLLTPRSNGGGGEEGGGGSSESALKKGWRTSGVESDG